MQIVKDDHRSIDRIKYHYAIEVKLAGKLRTATRAERKTLYAEVYKDLFLLVPDIPMALRVNRDMNGRLQFLSNFLKSTDIFLEIGAGDCSLSKAVANGCRKVYAIDVSSEIMKLDGLPKNLEAIITDGTFVSLARNSVNIAYSDQLLEHLHPDDLIDHLESIANVLVRGGKYICMTPSRLSGPHDISKYFDNVSRGLHLKEYTFSELCDIFNKKGFKNSRQLVTIHGITWAVPATIMKILEMIIKMIPQKFRQPLMKKKIFRRIFEIKLLAEKDHD